MWESFGRGRDPSTPPLTLPSPSFESSTTTFRSAPKILHRFSITDWRWEWSRAVVELRSLAVLDSRLRSEQPRAIRLPFQSIFAHGTNRMLRPLLPRSTKFVG